jgi:glutaconate CoA-transferase, subunit B
VTPERDAGSTGDPLVAREDCAPVISGATGATVPEAAPAERMAVFISRQIKNGEYVAIGTNLPVSTAGVLLAHLTHAPDLRISALSYFTNLSEVEQFHDLGQVASPRLARWAEAIWPLDMLLEAVPRMDWCFTGAVQVDKFGNTNLVGVGDDIRALRLRGPGSVGSSSVMATVKQYIVHTGKHNPRVLVERCDFRSAVGWGDGGDHRERLGLPGGGPRYVITPKAIMDFDEVSKRMRLKHLMPGISREEIIADTGFELLIPPEVEEMAPPTAQEMELLRVKIDTNGVLRG